VFLRSEHPDAVKHASGIVIAGFPDMALSLVHILRIGIGSIVKPAAIGFIDEVGIDMVPGCQE